jgi:uncharacterized UPF0160 family protein
VLSAYTALDTYNLHPEENMNKAVKVITHDRIAHADDVTAAAILRMAFGNVEVVRTRDPAILRAEAGREGTFFVDVGGQYDPQRRLFDHHQPAGAGMRDAAAGEWPYASAGLVWKEYGEQAVRAVLKSLNVSADDAGVTEIAQYIDDAVLRYIDAVDCGVRVRTAGVSLSALIASFNTTWFEKEAETFPLVMELAQVVLTNFIKKFAGKVIARDAVREAPRLLGGQVLLLETSMPWATVVAEEMPDVMMVLYPVNAGHADQWQLRVAQNVDITNRMRFPEAWAGLESSMLDAASGLSDTVFCHRSRHLAGAATKPAALAMAEVALHALTQHRVTALAA